MNPIEGTIEILSPGSTPKNIKGLEGLPQDGVKLYVKYRGDISPGGGGGSGETPLGPRPKNIQGIIVDSRVYPDWFTITIRVTKSPDAEDIGQTINIYPTRDIISLYPFRGLKDIVKKYRKKKKLDKLNVYAGVHNELAFLPEPPGRETIYASQRFKGKKRPEWPKLGAPELAEYYHDDDQVRKIESEPSVLPNFRLNIQDSAGNKYIGDEQLGGRRRRRKKKTKRKKRTKKKSRKKKRKTLKKKRKRRRKTRR